jgi:hypothetical protein
MQIAATALTSGSVVIACVMSSFASGRLIQQNAECLNDWGRSEAVSDE